MHIFQADASQLSFVKDLAYAIWPTAYGSILSQEQLTYMLDSFYSLESLQGQMEQGQVFLLAEEEGIYYGFAAYEVNCKTQGSTKLHKIYVLPNTQGKGVGKQLLSAVVQRATTAQNHTLFLNVNKYNSAKEFYQHLGFQVIADEVIDIGRGYVMDDYVMSKEI